MECKRPADLLHAATTGPLLDAFFQVYRELGYGFLERVYANALVIAARDLGLEDPLRASTTPIVRRPGRRHMRTRMNDIR